MTNLLLADLLHPCQNDRVKYGNGYRVMGLRRDNDYLIVSKDTDFRNRSVIHGYPPKVLDRDRELFDKCCRLQFEKAFR